MSVSASFTPTANAADWAVEAFSLCMFLSSHQTLRVVPHGTKGTGPRFVTRPVYLRSQFRNNTNTVSALVPLIHLLQVLCTRYASDAHHRALQTSGRGWADSKAVHRIECSGGALALLEVPLSRGCCLKCTVLPVQGGMLTRASKSTTNQRPKNPRSCVRVVYIVGDTLRHQPMGTGHVTVLQLCGPMAFRVLPWWLFIAGDTLCQHPMRTGHMTVLQSCGLMEFCALQWCHPMLASTRRTSCCTQMITLYGAQKWIQARTFPSPS